MPVSPLVAVSSRSVVPTGWLRTNFGSRGYQRSEHGSPAPVDISGEAGARLL